MRKMKAAGTVTVLIDSSVMLWLRCTVRLMSSVSSMGVGASGANILISLQRPRLDSIVGAAHLPIDAARRENGMIKWVRLHAVHHVFVSRDDAHDVGGEFVPDEDMPKQGEDESERWLRRAALPAVRAGHDVAIRPEVRFFDHRSSVAVTLVRVEQA